MKRLLIVCLVLLPCLASPMAHAQQSVPPAAAAPSSPAFVPYDNWVYDSVKTLQDAKIVIGYPDGTYSGRRPMTRYEFSTAIARLLPLLAPSAKESTSSEDLAPLRQGLRTRLRESQPALDALIRLVDEFKPELTALGQDVPAVQSRLADISLHSISPPFPDVPQNHWAYQSVETLRKMGVIKGEADGRFHG